MDFNRETFKIRVNKFLKQLIDKEDDVHLSLNSGKSDFALCFLIHTLFLIGNTEILKNKRLVWINKLEQNIISASTKNLNSKTFQQLLSLTISCLIILDNPKNLIIKNFCLKLIPKNINTYLNKIGADLGRPGSGNLSMFVAIFCIYLMKYYNINLNDKINSWVKFHKNSMNHYGFWSNKKYSNFRYSFFQNGFHQYEIFNYLNFHDFPLENMQKNILNLQDKYGHFSSIPGGTACHDYDAIYFLTYKNKDTNIKNNLNISLEKIANRILNIQHKDGGFAESLFVRPLNLNKFLIQLDHINIKNKDGRNERIQRFFANLRPKNSYIKNHWLDYKLDWNETNIFNTWFKILSLAKIDFYFNNEVKHWNFLNFPGIGYNGK